MALTLHRTWPDRPRPKDDWEIFDDGVPVGRIYENEASPNPASRWYWTLNGAAGGAWRHGIRGGGLAPTLNDAKTAWREAYDNWLRRKPEH
jgi:hypothetical protein